ncbi:head GIN domain-containing protein [Agriterribacter sp.]|uniref:head GIN domain-containing protein n=1 Tax=Agriterribacter sp. TaxID=2821509 RepID=UPI002CBC6BCA|nr:head GIN domain-containing protein [Agriterribacter sp.]HRO48388.1 head GIN domain-containing protein [Agriterribacter sp.]HRQ16609.1 head GIN domain-containing protein [Agriterribacter sp.]
MGVRFIFLLVAFSAVFASCKKDLLTGNGSIQTQERDVSAFTKVATQGSTLIHIVQGTDFEVKAKGYANLLPYLKTTVSNGVLSVRYEDTRNVRNDNSEVFITMPVLTGLSSQGSGDIYVAGTFNSSDNFDVTISGSADIVVEKGSADHFALHSSGSGDFKSFGFTAGTADITIAGSGNVEIAVVQQLKAKIRGSGSVYYKGDPVTIDDDISGSGKVIKK